MNNELRLKILKEMVRCKISLLPMHYCPDGHYTDFDEWNAVEVDEKYYDINFYSDGKKFYFTAYIVNGTYDRQNDQYFHLLQHDVLSIA